MKMVLGILILVGLHTAQSPALELVRTRPVPGGQEFAILTKEGDRHLVLWTQEPSGQWPTMIKQRHFSTFAAAKQTWQKWTETWPPDLRSQPAQPRQLREAEDLTLWPIENSWSEQWEQKYAQWLEQNVDSRFFSNDLQTDCADAIYALRWIFARDHRLPMANRLGGSGWLFSHASVREEWRRLPTHPDWRKDYRFLAALNYLLQLTYTASLVRDSYPIEISARWLRAGAHLSYPQGDTGHNYLVHRLRDGRDGRLPIALISSTLPRAFRPLLESDFSDPKQPGSGGFMRFRWPQASGPDWKLVDAEKMPGHSLEQYSPEFVLNDSFDEAVFNRVAPHRVIDHKRKVESLMTTLANRYLERQHLVQEGHDRCFPNLCPLGSRDYEDYGTPSRDQRILDLIVTTQNYVTEHDETEHTYNTFIWRHKFEIDGEHFRTYEVLLRDLILTWRQGHYSSDPNQRREARWGLH